MTPDRSNATRRPLTPAMFHVLLALTDGSAHGYAIMKAAAESAGDGVPMGPSTAYGTLDRLLEAGLVAIVDDQSEPRRFRLTASGRSRLTAEARRLARWTEHHRVRALLEGSG